MKPYMKNLTPQCYVILNHLKKGRTLTQRSALMDFGVMALPRRISDLKEAGYTVHSVMEKNTLTGQRYARYSLTK
ncbi:helix-turn-helix domain-containing protein [Endozoicomonas ascidiicola]|uniref:helix-turn-helix domain-containing protein n=1 Tax=Endozoicomonas ascidiicola TaxID=1698521 RepID=UPI000A93134C|nr:helix-turn-helix domain-containing protein [Endozoicomonas ascidiicola]